MVLLPGQAPRPATTEAEAQRFLKQRLKQIHGGTFVGRDVAHRDRSGPRVAMEQTCEHQPQLTDVVLVASQPEGSLPKASTSLA
jgi:hypothetical protein